jgi:hypothetical protein
VSDRIAVRLRIGHGLTVTETALAFLHNARKRGELCRPLDWIPEVHHPIGNGEAVIPDALLYYHRNRDHNGGDSGGVMLRAFVEVDRATMGPERLAAKLTAYTRLHHHVPHPAQCAAAGCFAALESMAPRGGTQPETQLGVHIRLTTPRR